MEAIKTKRKVVKQGPSTFMISLPSKWVKKFNLQKGDEVELEEKGSSLTLQTEKGRKKVRKVVVNLDNFNKMLISRFFDEIYRQGVEEVIVTFSKDKLPYYKTGTEFSISEYISKVIAKYIGMEIVSKTENKIVIESLMSNEESEKLDMIEQRVFFMIKEFLDEFLKAMDGDFKKFHEISYDYHDNIAKFSNYFLRLLNFSDLPEENKTRLFGLYMVIDKVIDKIRHTSERVNELCKISGKTKSCLKELFDFFIYQFDLVLKKNISLEDMDKIIKRRYELVNKVNSEKFTYEEARVISESRIMLDTINDFVEAYVTLNMSKYTSDY